MSQTILFTANPDSAATLPALTDMDKVLHLPLQHFIAHLNPEENRIIKSTLNDFTFIIHGNLRNARYFVEWMQQNDQLADVQNRINLAIDKPTSEYLESKKIPAVLFRENGKPIDVLEFMLRISKQGTTLYPTTDNKTEEMPGLLKELEMPVSEFTVCKETTISEDRLNEYRERVSKANLDAILFHNRSSITRIKTAFPELNFDHYKLISGSPGVTEKLREEGHLADIEADGSWRSIADVIEEISGISS
jgi:uroporphyrinogen-III synthase